MLSVTLKPGSGNITILVLNWIVNYIWRQSVLTYAIRGVVVGARRRWIQLITITCFKSTQLDITAFASSYSWHNSVSLLLKLLLLLSLLFLAKLFHINIRRCWKHAKITFNPLMKKLRLNCYRMLSLKPSMMYTVVHVSSTNVSMITVKYKSCSCERSCNIIASTTTTNYNNNSSKCVS